MIKLLLDSTSSDFERCDKYFILHIYTFFHSIINQFEFFILFIFEITNERALYYF